MTAQKIRKNAVNSEIKDGAVKGSDVGEATLRKVPSATSADNAAHASSAEAAANATRAASADSATDSVELGGFPAAKYLRSLWEHVSHGPARIDTGSGATRVQTLSTGYDRVYFERDVRQCAPIATIGSHTGIYWSPGDIQAAAITTVPGVTNAVNVVTTTDSGTRTSVEYSVAVFC